MKKYNTIVFDLDGTLTDPAAGLVAGFEYALKKKGISYPSREYLLKFIGPPLVEFWQGEFGLSFSEAEELVLLFREYYNVYGWWDNRIYPGVYDMLSELKRRGKTLLVATSKPEDTAKRVLKLFGIDKFFDYIGGADGHKKRDKKWEVLSYSLRSGGIDKDKGGFDGAILVGDRCFDAEGAKLCGIDSLGILWGHGSKEEIMNSGFTYTARTPEDVLELLE